MARDPSVLVQYSDGFQECASEVSRYLKTIDSKHNDGLRQRLLRHLSCCIANQPSLLNLTLYDSLRYSSDRALWSKSDVSDPLNASGIEMFSLKAENGVYRPSNQLENLSENELLPSSSARAVNCSLKVKQRRSFSRQLRQRFSTADSAERYHSIAPYITFTNNYAQVKLMNGASDVENIRSRHAACDAGKMTQKCSSVVFDQEGEFKDSRKCVAALVE